MSQLAKDGEVDLPNRLIKPYNVSDKKEASNGSEDALEEFSNRIQS